MPEPQLTDIPPSAWNAQTLKLLLQQMNAHDATWNTLGQLLADHAHDAAALPWLFKLIRNTTPQHADMQQQAW